MNIPTSWHLDNYITASEMWLPVCLCVSLSLYLAVRHSFLLSRFLSVPRLVFLKLSRHFWPNSFVNKKKKVSPFATETN